MQAYLVLSSARASAGKEAEVQTSVATDGGSRGEEKSSDTVEAILASRRVTIEGSLLVGGSFLEGFGKRGSWRQS